LLTTKKKNPDAYLTYHLQPAGHIQFLAKFACRILAYQLAPWLGLPDSQPAGKTDQRLGIPVLPLNRLLFPLFAARDELFATSVLRRGRESMASLQIPGLPVSSSLTR